MKRLSVIALSMVLWFTAASAEPNIYADQQLADDKQRYAKRFGFLLQKGLLAFATPQEQRALAGVVVRHPARGKGPLSVKSLIFEDRPMVRAPVASLKFIEDLSVAYAWRFTNNYSLEPIDEYLAVLKHRSGDVFGNSRRADPLNALGVPSRIWESDKKVDELSLRFRNTAWAFILAHELGHLRLGHNERRASPSESQLREEQADEFAVQLLSRSGTIPMGMILWLQATAGYMKNRSDFSSDAAYHEWVSVEASHPVNGRRMQNLARLMQQQSSAVADANEADVLKFIAQRLKVIGETVENPDMQSLLKRCARRRSAEDLKRLQDQSCL